MCVYILIFVFIKLPQAKNDEINQRARTESAASEVRGSLRMFSFSKFRNLVILLVFGDINIYIHDYTFQTLPRIEETRETPSEPKVVRIDLF